MPWNPTPKVDCRYGAPMGRSSLYQLTDDCDQIIHLTRVHLIDGGCYDSGGAYWGHGEPLWAYGLPDAIGFIRATDREAAKTAIRLMHPNVRFYR